MSVPVLGSLELNVLLAVARLGDGAFGLAVRRELASATGREHSVGAIYTTLQRLEDKGLVTSRTTEPLPVRGGRARRIYAVSAAGRRAIGEAERIARQLLFAATPRLSPSPS